MIEQGQTQTSWAWSCVPNSKAVGEERKGEGQDKKTAFRMRMGPRVERSPGPLGVLPFHSVHCLSLLPPPLAHGARGIDTPL